MNRIRLLIGVAAASALVILLTVPAATGARVASKSTTVTVTMKEFRFILSRKTVPHGKVVFKLVNKGHLAHDFKIGTKKSALIQHGKTSRIAVTLSPGKHSYKCTVPGHAAAGMKGVLKVT